MIKLAAIEDNLMLIGGLRARAATVPDIDIAAVTATVDDLLPNLPGPYDAVLLNPLLRADPDPAANVRRLIDAGHRVLLVDGSADPAMVAASLAAGSHGYLTRDHCTQRPRRGAARSRGGFVLQHARRRTARSPDPETRRKP
jgi:two-component system, NarL family, nitrate/nitrite response regulator NarL